MLVSSVELLLDVTTIATFISMMTTETKSALVAKTFLFPTVQILITCWSKTFFFIVIIIAL